MKGYYTYLGGWSFFYDSGGLSLDRSDFFRSDVRGIGDVALRKRGVLGGWGDYGFRALRLELLSMRINTYSAKRVLTQSDFVVSQLLKDVGLLGRLEGA